MAAQLRARHAAPTWQLAITALLLGLVAAADAHQRARMCSVCTDYTFTSGRSFTRLLSACTPCLPHPAYCCCVCSWCVTGFRCIAEPGAGKEWGPDGIRACRRGYAKRSPRDVPCSLCDSKRTSFASRLGLKGDSLCISAWPELMMHVYSCRIHNPAQRVHVCCTCLRAAPASVRMTLCEADTVSCFAICVLHASTADAPHIQLCRLRSMPEMPGPQGQGV
jgi:hypothetical protein